MCLARSLVWRSSFAPDKKKSSTPAEAHARSGGLRMVREEAAAAAQPDRASGTDPTVERARAPGGKQRLQPRYAPPPTQRIVLALLATTANFFVWCNCLAD